MPSAEKIDLNSAYKIACDCNPGEEVKFCCDLGDFWLFKFVPAGSNGSVINGHFAFVVEKKSGNVGQCDMLANMSKIEGKINLVNMLKH